MSKRIQYIDLAKGLCILLVVLFHVYQHIHYIPEFIKSLSCFRMPLYFFLSGLFFKEYEGFIGFFLRKVNKLFIPFAFFYLVTSWGLSNLLHDVFGYTVLFEESLGISGLWAFITQEKFANDPIWFLWVLFLVNIYFYLLLTIAKRITTNDKRLPLILAAMCFIVGIIGSVVLSRRINLLAFLDSAMSALPFFAFGYLFNKFTDILFPNKWDKYLPFIIIVFFAITYIFGGQTSYRLNRFSINPFWMNLSQNSSSSGHISNTFFTIYFKKSSSKSINSSKSQNAISGSIIQNSFACVFVFEFSDLSVGPKV